jgi:translation initiation factor IF-2
VDATMKEGVGIIVEVLFHDGIARVKDYFICGNQSGRIKTILVNDKSVQTCNSVEIADIVGFDSIPTIGSKLYVVPEISFQDLLSTSSEIISKTHKKEINFICKSDQEAKLQTLIDVVQEYGNIIDSSIGILKKTDMEQAKTFKAIIVFWQRIPNTFKALLSQYPDIKYIQDEVIYQIEQQINKLNEKPPEEKLVDIGTLRIIRTFLIKGKNIAGCKVLDGFAQIGCKCVVKREGEEIIWGKIDSLQKENKDADKAKKDTECGIILGIEKSLVSNFALGDEIVVFEK